MGRLSESRTWALLLAAFAAITLFAVLLGSESPEAPAPAQSASTPAPLPPATGIDGEGVVEGVDPAQAQPDGLPADPELLPDTVQAVPDPGLPVKELDPSTEVPRGPPGVAVEIPTEEYGVGGEIYVSSPAFKKKQRLAAGFYYPSGSLHGAWDVGIWTGTKVFAATDGTIVGKRDGVKNNPPGYNPGSGAASNWLLLCANVAGKPSVLYYQHLSPGIDVKRGQKVTGPRYDKSGGISKYGTPLGESGNSGNSTGPHLHLSASTSPWACKNITQSRAESIRYRYLSQPSSRIFAPSKFWIKPAPKPAVSVKAAAKACRTNTAAGNFRYARKGLKMRNTSADKCGPEARKRIKKVQRELGYRGTAADGIPGRQSLTLICKRGDCKVVS